MLGLPLTVAKFDGRGLSKIGKIGCKDIRLLPPWSRGVLCGIRGIKFRPPSWGLNSLPKGSVISGPLYFAV